MNRDRLINLIDDTVSKAKDFAIKFYKGDESRMSDTIKVLLLLKQEVQQNPEHIHARVLRAMHDIGMGAYREYENSSLEQAIYNLTGELYREIPNYKHLTPLRGDFGKGNPI